MDNASNVGVKLEIYNNWHWWIGYQSSNYRSKWTQFRGCQKTKEPDSYTETAFPSLKPDIDLFGVPRRSRKQRGWHQVAVPFLGRPSERPGKRVHFRALAKPSDIPPELFDNILHHVTRWDGTRERREMRSMIARCGLVCRYWSVKCQESLFDLPGLDSRKDALQLLEFMGTPTSAVSSFVRGVSVREVQAVSGTPWLHRISVISDRAHRTLGNYQVELKGPLPAGQRMRSIHHQLPRLLPAHFSRHIWRLSLTDIHFQELDDLMHLVWEMPDLDDLYCTQVTWGSLPTALPRRRPRNQSEFLQVIKMSECGPRPVEASVWLAASTQHREQAFLAPDDLTRVVSFARESEKSASTSVSANFDRDYFDVDVGQDRCVRFHGNRQDSRPLSPEWHIDTVVIDIRESQDTEMAENSNLDWKAMDEAVSSFPGMRRMVVGLDSREDMVCFDQEVAMVHMPLLSGGGMLKYALWDPAGVNRHGRKGTWLRASPDSEDTEASGCYEARLHAVYK